MSQFSPARTHNFLCSMELRVFLICTKGGKDNMPAIAITDHGNMFGVLNLLQASKHNTKDNPNTIKPIVGCEFYLVENRHKTIYQGR